MVYEAKLMQNCLAEVCCTISRFFIKVWIWLS